MRALWGGGVGDVGRFHCMSCRVVVEWHTCTCRAALAPLDAQRRSVPEGPGDSPQAVLDIRAHAHVRRRCVLCHEYPRDRGCDNGVPFLENLTVTYLQGPLWAASGLQCIDPAEAQGSHGAGPRGQIHCRHDIGGWRPWRARGGHRGGYRQLGGGGTVRTHPHSLPLVPVPGPPAPKRREGQGVSGVGEKGMGGDDRDEVACPKPMWTGGDATRGPRGGRRRRGGDRGVEGPQQVPVWEGDSGGSAGVQALARDWVQLRGLKMIGRGRGAGIRARAVLMTSVMPQN